MDDSRLRVSAEGVSKKFCRDLRRSLWYGVQDIGAELLGRTKKPSLRRQEFLALQDVSFELRRGDSLALIGRNGAGKSTLLKLLSGLIKPDAGRVLTRGRLGALIELGAGFNPVLTGLENIQVNAAVLGFTQEQTRRQFESIVEFAEIGDFIDAPVQSYSSGMRVRLGFAVAAHLNPDVLLVDEVLAVGDSAFQRKCLRHMRGYVENGGCLILVSHNMHLIQSMCRSCLVLDRGRVAYQGPTASGISTYYAAQRQLESRSPAEEAGRSPADPPREETPLVITGLEVTAPSGGVISPGGELRLELRYRSRADLDRVVWGFSIWTEDQWVRITTCFSKYDGFEYPVHQGRGTFACVIDDLFLAPGSYAVKAGIYDPVTSWPIARIGWDDPAVPFEVTSSGSEKDSRHMIDGDLCHMTTRWTPAAIEEPA